MSHILVTLDKLLAHFLGDILGILQRDCEDQMKNPDQEVPKHEKCDVYLTENSEGIEDQAVIIEGQSHPTPKRVLPKEELPIDL